MPTLRITGWPPDKAPSAVPPELTRLFYDDTGMDADDVVGAFARLKKGKVFSVPFDPGDEEPARRMMEKLETLGLASELREDDSLATDEGQGEESGRRSINPFILYGGLFVLAVIIRSPWLGMLLLAIGVGGLGLAFLIRMVTRRADRRLEVLGKLDLGKDAGNGHEQGRAR